jgi:hypothetical protein
MVQENMLCIKSIYMNNTTASAAPTKLCLYYLAKLAGVTARSHSQEMHDRVIHFTNELRIPLFESSC